MRAIFGRAWLPALPALLALALHWGVILSRGFDGLYGQDAFAYYDYAIQLSASLRRLSAPPPFFWPLGYPAAILAGFLALGETPLAGQLVSSLAGAGVALLTGLLGRDLALKQALPAATARQVGLLAGLLAAVSGQLWQWSITLMADTLSLCWATLAAWALVRYSLVWRRRWLLLAAAGLALAICTRWAYLLLAPALLAYWLLATRGRARASLDLLLAVALGLALLTPQLLYELGEATPFRTSLGHQWVTSWSPLNALRSSFITPDGHATYPLPVALFYAKAVASPRLLVPLFTPLLLVGALGLLRARRWLAALLLGGWLLLSYGFLMGIPYQNFRFTLALLPPEMVLTAFGAVWLRERLAPRLRLLLPAYLLAGVLLGLWYNAGVLDEFIDRKDADVATTRWVEQQAPAGARVLAFGLTLTLDHYSDLQVEELFTLSTDQLRQLSGDGRPTYLLLPLESVTSQWAGHAPELNYRWLEAGPGLSRLGALNGYTLFSVDRD